MTNRGAAYVELQRILDDLRDDGPHHDRPHNDGPHDDKPHDDRPHDDGLRDGLCIADLPGVDTAQDLARVVGRYISPENGALGIEVDGGMLAASIDGRSYGLRPRNTRSFVFDDGPFARDILVFDRPGDDGRFCEAFAGSRRWFREGCPPPDDPLPPSGSDEFAGVYRASGFGDAKIYVRAGLLRLQLGGIVESAMHPEGRALFRLRGGPFAEERVRFLRMGPRIAAFLLSGMCFLRVEDAR